MTPPGSSPTDRSQVDTRIAEILRQAARQTPVRLTGMTGQTSPPAHLT